MIGRMVGNMKGWYGNKYNHSLASKGIKTVSQRANAKGIINTHFGNYKIDGRKRFLVRNSDDTDVVSMTPSQYYKFLQDAISIEIEINNKRQTGELDNLDSYEINDLRLNPMDYGNWNKEGVDFGDGVNLDYQFSSYIEIKMELFNFVKIRLQNKSWKEYQKGLIDYIGKMHEEEDKFRKEQPNTFLRTFDDDMTEWFGDE